MMPVGTADGEANRALSQPPGFTLDAGEAHAIVNNEVVARVLSERNKNRKSSLLQSEHHREGCSIANSLWMFHVVKSVNPASDGLPCGGRRSSSAGRASPL